MSAFNRWWSIQDNRDPDAKEFARKVWGDATLTERSACAKILETERDEWEDYFASEESLEEEGFRSMTQARIDTLNDMAQAIRARNNPA